jgi:beta-galactosidase
MSKQSVSMLTILTIFWMVSLSLLAQTSYHINVTKARTEVIRGHLDLGGRNIKGDTIGVNSFYMERNNKPFIPVIGEFHYARYPEQYWDEQLKKIRAGGITVVATYVFWNLHEFKEGEFNWQNNLNLRHFVELALQNDLEVIVRIGPFAHGEMRNGGLPDWLYGRPIEVRTNDPAYLFYANRLYQQIGQQLKGLMFKDGGPIIGIQIENEYQHSAAPWAFTYQDAPRERTVGRRDNKITQDGVGINNMGNEFADVGRDHMKTLKQLAVNAGLIAPIYTATGWGRATIIEKGSIPVMAGYAFPFWSKSVAPSPFYLYKDMQLTPDYSPVSYDVTLYPSMAAELGTGMANIYSRRPRVPGESFLPMMVRTIGSGSNGLGYYMYHGGTTPSFGNFFMSEQHGLHNKSYDYQAPIGEFGYTTSGFYELKLINAFLASFGSDLAPLYTVLPTTNDTIKANNTTTLRYAVRSNGNKGYLFMHNYQDHLQTANLTNLKIDITTQTGTITFPESGNFTLKSGMSAIFPFNTTINGVKIKLATVQPLYQFSNKGHYYNINFSIDEIEPEIVFEGKVTLSGTGFKTIYRNGNTIARFNQNGIGEVKVNNTSFLILPRQWAQNAYLTGTNNKHLVISNALVLSNNNKLSLVSQNLQTIDVSVYPSVKSISSDCQVVKKTSSPTKNISQWQITLPVIEPNIQLIQATDRHFVLKAHNMNWAQLNDVSVTFDYRGDRGICMMKGELQTDHLYTSKPWTIGLKRFAEQLKTEDMYFYFIPMAKDAPYLSYLDKEVLPDFGDKREFLEIKKPIINVEQKIEISLKY